MKLTTSSCNLFCLPLNRFEAAKLTTVKRMKENVLISMAVVCRLKVQNLLIFLQQNSIVIMNASN